LYKVVTLIALLFVLSPALASTKLIKHEKKNEARREIFMSKFENAYKVETFEDFKKNFLYKFENVSKK
jgi:hypothetical protein